MATQFFYLLEEDYDESSFPIKVFLQPMEAIKYGRRLMTKTWEASKDTNHQFYIYRQPINATGKFDLFKKLKPYPSKVLVDAGLIETKPKTDKAEE